MRASTRGSSCGSTSPGTCTSNRNSTTPSPTTRSSPAGAADNRISIRNERLEIPVLLGLRFGAFRLFGGVRFRVTDSSRSNNQQLLRVKFDSGKSDLVGGIGFDIRKFFLDFRVSGISWDKTRYGFSSGGATRRVEVSRDIVYGASLGFFF